ncbi:ribosomal oxygenase 1 [Halyomorpha halys]|uniref:ribosomal oxygenase 1 n=1 Tax=Halyomorpha halys TaxID=286706 RepID=UPI0006D5042C|nr:ribosomal oxygenase 1 [Halyomorpha halys]
MVPDDVNVSAFAVYSGKVKKSVSKNQKRRLKIKTQKPFHKNGSSVERDLNPILVKKKVNSDLAIEVPSLRAGLESKEQPIVKVGINNKKKKKLKKKKKVHVPVLEDQSNPQVSGFVKINDDEESSVSPTKSDESISVSIRKAKKLKRKISESLSPLESQQLISPSVLNTMKEPPKKKKVIFVSPEPNAENETKSKKPIVCTPRFEKKRKVTNENVTKKRLLDVSPGNTLQKVDDYLAHKKEADLKLSKISSQSTNGPRTVKDVELAHLAKTEMLMKSSEVSGKNAFEKILDPVSVDTFMSDYWEKAPIHIPNRSTNKFSNFISTERIDAVLRDRVVTFGKHLDVTSYTDGKRETHNLEGRANAHVVWDFYSNGCSIRLLNPQYFFHSVHCYNAMLQEYFGCFVGANAYLTPPMSQGFAPHYDDIEAFILQIEGSKIWRLYQPLNKHGYLPRFSSRNLLDEEIGEPILEVKLNPGDVLYFPRGYIHQGRTEEEHSLHLTLSVYQKTAWCDLLEKLLPLTLKKAASLDVDYRKGLPLGYLKSAGLVHKNSSSRKEVVKVLKKLVSRLGDFLETDAAIDQMGLSFIHDALPPVFTAPEAACTVFGDGWKMRPNGNLEGQVIITVDTKVRWTRAFCYRIVEEEVCAEDGTFEKQLRIYHSLENSKEYHAEEPQYLIVDFSLLPSLRHLTLAYPNFTKLTDLPHDDEDVKILFVSDLWDRGLLMTDTPLQVFNNSEPAEENDGCLTVDELEILNDLEEKIPKNENEESLSGSESGEEEFIDDESVEISDSEEESA